MKLMQPIMTANIHPNYDYVYEMKYDGFRASIVWSQDEIKIMSRNNIDLTKNFPEIIICCENVQKDILELLPLQLDGELVVLNNEFQANFSLIQQRGRLKTKQKVIEQSIIRPATFVAFDLLQLNGKSYENEGLVQRKKQMNKLFKKIKNTNELKLIQTYKNYDEIVKAVFDYKAEGIIAKRTTSTYEKGKQHNDWFKAKNWRKIYAFLTTYNSENDYFNVAVYEGEEIVQIGKCKHGLNQKEFTHLKTIFMANGNNHDAEFTLPPAICASIHTLDLQGNELREPNFAQLAPTLSPIDCTKDKLRIDLAMLPDVTISNEEKIFWPNIHGTKADLLIYMREIFPYMIPYVKNRALTVIRCPDGVEEASFFQKNLPSYAPDYVDYIEEDGKRIQLCNTLASLIWFANHSAIEYHLPFQPMDTPFPTEIVFDLDPSSKDDFPLAIEASLLIKQLLDELELVSFIKTSGKKGMQIYIPLIKQKISYDETAIFTEAIAKTVEKMAPTRFTTERFKKNRGKKLYIDYVQHGKNRTIISPYSPRITEEATVSTPLYWEEIKEGLHPTQFTIKNVVERVQKLGCPWLNNYELARMQKLTKVLKMIHK